MRLTPGMQAPPFEATAITGATVSLRAFRGRTVLLKFYRFATCPVCNLHLHHFACDYAALEAAGIRAIVFFHSPHAKLVTTRRDEVPFPLVADPDKRMFRLYGVETGWRGMISPAVMRDYVRALCAGFPSGMFTSDGGMLGNPADFLIDGDGRVVFARYGRHYADSLTAREVLERARVSPCALAAAIERPSLTTV